MVIRLSGQTRFDTAIAISQNGWKKSDYVILTNGFNYSNALGSAALSKKYDAPILLTNTDALNKAVDAEIARLGAQHVILLGGTDVIFVNIQNIY